MLQIPRWNHQGQVSHLSQRFANYPNLPQRERPSLSIGQLYSHQQHLPAQGSGHKLHNSARLERDKLWSERNQHWGLKEWGFVGHILERNIAGEQMARVGDRRGVKGVAINKQEEPMRVRILKWSILNCSINYNTNFTHKRFIVSQISHDVLGKIVLHHWETGNCSVYFLRSHLFG